MFLDDIEREMCSKYYLAMAAGGTSAGARTQSLLSALGTEMPWLGPADNSPERLQTQLKEKYNRHMEEKKKQKERKKKKEKKA